MSTAAYIEGYLQKTALDLDINVGDILLGGRFKNKRTEVKELGTDELGQPTVNGRKLLNFRIEKDLPPKKRSKATQELEKAAAEDKRWKAVDLDGTLAKYYGWKGPQHIGRPQPDMVKRVKRWLKAGKNVKIFTARVSGDNGTARRYIKAWCKEHLGCELPVTNVKDQFCTTIWDDRARDVKRNTGKQRIVVNKQADEYKRPKLSNKLKGDYKESHTVSFKIQGDATRGLIEMLEYIRQNGAPGHSFGIVVDPEGDTGQTQRFGFDGDGSDSIDKGSLKVDDKTCKFKVDKEAFLQGYMKKESGQMNASMFLQGYISKQAKAVSRKQQRFMGMVHAAKKGDKPASKEVAEAAESMTGQEAEDFAKTKHKGLPEKKEEKEAAYADIKLAGHNPPLDMLRQMFDDTVNNSTTMDEYITKVRKELGKEAADTGKQTLATMLRQKLAANLPSLQRMTKDDLLAMVAHISKQVA